MATPPGPPYAQELDVVQAKPSQAPPYGQELDTPRSLPRPQALAQELDVPQGKRA